VVGQIARLLAKIKNMIMKPLIIILIFLNNFCFGQEVVIDSCGLDSSITLNKYESQYFNQSLEKQRIRSNFDFQKKKVGFAHGNFGNGVISKKEYFDRWGKVYFENNSHVLNQLIILTEDEKQQSGGFDAIIISWSKIGVAGKHKKRLIENLNKK
jgi:hypothetical protein